MESIYDYVVQVLAETCDIEPQDITEETNFFSDLGIESVDFLDVVYELDKHYKVTIPVGRWMSEINEGDEPEVEHFVMDNFVRAITSLINESLNVA